MKNAKFDENFEIRERCKGVFCLDLGESFPISFQIDPNSNEYIFANFGFDTAKNEPCKVCTLSAYGSPRSEEKKEDEKK